MKWYHQLRWKLVVSHLLVGVVSILTLIGTAYFLTDDTVLRKITATLRFLMFDEPASAPVDNVSYTDAPFESIIRDALIVSAVAALEAALIVSLSVSKRIVEPVQEITAVSKRLAEGFYRERTEIQSDDELAELSRSVNQLAATLEQTEQRRLALLADVSHELRTPLATIGGYMEGLIDGVVKPDEQTFRLVLSESERLQRLIEDLQLLSRVEAQQIPTEPRLFNLLVSLRDVTRQLRQQFTAREVELQLVAPELDLMVYADADRVNQVLINLLTNALRYTPRDGQVTLRVRDDNEFVLVSVEDTGVGIAPEHLPHLFERFYRVDKSRARSSGGSGVGLTIARHLVYAQGGDMWATSAGPGLGSQFYFTLPRSAKVIANLSVQARREQPPLADPSLQVPL